MLSAFQTPQTLPHIGNSPAERGEGELECTPHGFGRVNLRPGRSPARIGGGG